ncbi:hypothetical protein ACTFIR_006711 [Dictyostelium discoideum]
MNNKDKPIYCQNVKEGLEFNGITLHLTSFQHGSKEAFENPELAKLLGEVTGVVFEMDNKKKFTLLVYQFGLIESKKLYLIGFGAIIMGKEDIDRIRSVSPDSLIIATHMEAINHCILSRKESNDYVKENKYSNVKIPLDGETIEL